MDRPCRPSGIAEHRTRRLGAYPKAIARFVLAATRSSRRRPRDVERAKPWAGGRLRFGAAVAAARRLPCGARCGGERRTRPRTGGIAPARRRLCSVLGQAALDASPWGDAQPPQPCAPRRRTGAQPAARPRLCVRPAVGSYGMLGAASRRGAGGRRAQRLCGAEQRSGAGKERYSATTSHVRGPYPARVCEVAPAQRAPQGSRREAATAAPKRSPPTARASARSDRGGPRPKKRAGNGLRPAGPARRCPAPKCRGVLAQS